MGAAGGPSVVGSPRRSFRYAFDEPPAMDARLGVPGKVRVGGQPAKLPQVVCLVSGQEVHCGREGHGSGHRVAHGGIVVPRRIDRPEMLQKSLPVLLPEDLDLGRGELRIGPDPAGGSPNSDPEAKDPPNQEGAQAVPHPQAARRLDLGTPKSLQGKALDERQVVYHLDGGPLSLSRSPPSGLRGELAEPLKDEAAPILEGINTGFEGPLHEVRGS